MSEKQSKKEKSDHKNNAQDMMEVRDDVITTDIEKAINRPFKSSSNEFQNMSTPKAGPSSFNQNSRSSTKLTPSAAMKANLRQMRIEKLQAITGGLSGKFIYFLQTKLKKNIVRKFFLI